MVLQSAQPTPDTVKLEKERNEYLVASQVAQQEVKLLREQLAAFQTQAAAKVLLWWHTPPSDCVQLSFAHIARCCD